MKKSVNERWLDSFEGREADDIYKLLKLLKSTVETSEEIIMLIDIMLRGPVVPITSVEWLFDRTKWNRTIRTDGEKDVTIIVTVKLHPTKNHIAADYKALEQKIGKLEN